MKPNEFLYAMGQLIRAHRIKQRQTQLALAQMVGVKRTSIVNIEAGRQDTTITRLLDIAWALNCRVKDLVPN